GSVQRHLHPGNRGRDSDPGPRRGSHRLSSASGSPEPIRISATRGRVRIAHFVDTFAADRADRRHRGAGGDWGCGAGGGGGAAGTGALSRERVGSTVSVIFPSTSSTL